MGYIFRYGHKNDPKLKDHKKSFHYYHLSALQGNAKGQFNVGENFYLGETIPKDMKQAYHWLSLAAQQNFVSSFDLLGDILLNGRGRKKNYTLAAKYFTLSLENNFFSQYSLGFMNLKGLGMPINYPRALELFTLAVNHDVPNVDALYELGKMCVEGKGTVVDYKAAFNYFTKAAELGDSMAHEELGELYYDGNGVKVDMDKAIEHYKFSTHKQSAYSLGYIYLHKRNDSTTAMEYFNVGVKKGCKNCSYELGLMSVKEKKYGEAVKHFRVAAMDDDVQSVEEMEQLMYEVNDVDLLEVIIYTLHDLGKLKGLEFSGVQAALEYLADKLIGRGDRQKISEFMHAGLDRMTLILQDGHNASIILEEYSKLHEIKWWLIIKSGCDSGGAFTMFPITVLSIVGSYLPWFESLTLDPYRLAQHSQLLELSSTPFGLLVTENMKRKLDSLNLEEEPDAKECKR